jgi:hypothetical protein
VPFGIRRFIELKERIARSLLEIQRAQFAQSGPYTLPLFPLAQPQAA